MNKAEQFAQKINQKRIRKEIEQLIGTKIEEIAKIVEDEKHISEIRRLDKELSDLYAKLDEVSELAKIQPKKGDKGEKGERGQDGITKIIKEITEKNITAEDVRDLLESLKGNDRLDAKAIKNLPKPIQQYIAGGSGTLDHADLRNLAWSVAGHTIDSDMDFVDNNLLNARFPVAGFKMTDGANIWDVTIDESGALITSLFEANTILLEDGTSILLEDGTNFLLE